MCQQRSGGPLRRLGQTMSRESDFELQWLLDGLNLTGEVFVAGVAGAAQVLGYVAMVGVAALQEAVRDSANDTPRLQR
jgi:hypothetical protein